ncbi:hypothetical protein HMPREF9020_01495, partial [Scardovia inopinata F0304]
TASFAALGAWNYPLPLLIKWVTNEALFSARLELSSSSSDKMANRSIWVDILLGIILFLF